LSSARGPVGRGQITGNGRQVHRDDHPDQDFTHLLEQTGKN
jgi:hypothetical protein